MEGVHVWSKRGPEGCWEGRGGFVIIHLPKSLMLFYIINLGVTRIGERHTQSHITFDGIMATKPGILTDWPWTPLGSFKVNSVF